MGLPDMNLSIFQPLFILHIIFFLFLSLLHSGFPATPSLGGNETDRLALLDIKGRITGDPLKVMSSWNESIHFCRWQGVTCGHKHQRVTVLDLHSHQLVGSLPSHIGNMSFLKALILHNNSFSPIIPQEIGQLFRLQTLALENNSFGGKIPANISYCYNLIYLGLAGNKIVGKVPTELSSLPKLQTLVLDSNHLTGGIPFSFGNFSSLNKLSAAENNFEGSIPNTLGQLKSLTYLELGVNKLFGLIPPSIYNLSSIIHFNLRRNQIHGSLPSDFGFTLPNLEVFNVYDNQLSGHIPVSVSNATNLVFLSFARNNFTGKVPNLAGLQSLQWLRLNHNNFGNGEDGDLDLFSSLTNCSNLEVLSINYNSLGGLLPKSLSNFSTKLTRMVLSQNRIRGSITTGIGNLVNLEELSVKDNQLSGVIPDDIGALHKLIILFLNGNKLTGNIPFSLGNLTLLNRLNLSSNNLEGNIPSSLGECKNIVMILLSQNKLTGTIPKQVIGLSSLSISLDFSRNHLVGPLPLEIGQLKNLGYLDVSDNNLSGSIPGSLGSCTSLESLYIEGNMFQGTIPSSLASLRGIQNLDFSCNNLSGQIPKYLEGFTFLLYLNLSFNNFEGEVPIQGVFNNTSAISIVGNRRLCGGVPQLKLSRCPSNESTKKRLHLTLVLIISIVSGLLGLILMLSFLIFYCLRKKTRKEPTSSSSMVDLLNVSYEDLLKATDGFSSANLIGVGSFGSVYKGILDQQGVTIVAVKVLNLQHKGASKSFMAECEAWRNIRHRNLLKILSVCSSLDFRGNDFKALVYEFMVNGSLDEWLHQIPKADEEHGEPKYLNLLQRLNIAIDIACALEYLHHHCQTPISHCDLKPSNVLLDSDMTAHVGDFGLARFLPMATNQFSSNQTSSLGMKGSIGYTAPEYGMGSEVSTYGDLYSYGILLLEMFIGKRPSNDKFVDGLNLHNFAKMALPEQVMEIADPILFHNVEAEEETTAKKTPGKDCSTGYNIQECLISVIRIGVTCSMDLPRKRMSIRDAARELHKIKDNLLILGLHGGAK